MNISYKWLKELIEIDLSPDELAAKLTGIGLAVEGIEAHGDDSVFDIDVTSNRSDCLSHLGVAREIGAILGKSLDNAPEPSRSTNAFAADVVTIEEPSLCHRFTGRIIRGVKVGASPQWLVDRLESIGERSINNVADVTNYVMHELGQPMHAFDLDTLEGNRIVVRRALFGETITTLDELERELDEATLAICDAVKPVAIAGIIGGLDTSITEATVNVFLEVAYFEKASIRATARKQSIRTEAAHRFERGVDILNLTRASERATSLITEIAGGEVDGFVDVFPAPRVERTVRSADITSSVARLTGLEVEDEECFRILGNLGFTTEDNTNFSVPSWRHDVSVEEDLVEEVARHFGYDKITPVLPPSYFAGEYQPDEARLRDLRATLTNLGFDEAMSYSFIDLDNEERFAIVPGVTEEGVEYPFVRIRDAVIEGATLMRGTSLPGLLDAARTNFNHQRRDLRLFEIGTVFGTIASAARTPNEVRVLTLLISGSERLADRDLQGRALDFYDISGSVQAVIESVGTARADLLDADAAHLQPGQAASASLNGNVIGYLGRIRDELAAHYKFKVPVFCAELNLDLLLEAEAVEVRYQPLPRFPAISRDLSLDVPRSTTFAELKEAAFDHPPSLLASVDFLDVFEAPDAGDGRKSLTLRCTYRNPHRTLNDQEVEVQHQELVAKLTGYLR
ncbi:MAG: phenylalanine--tRNA ligase subunit beta [Blastocatellia bacterium]|nr:phenylalanine--tRNA ligase subunit beta [Blastocatellia bacterium]